ncbi:MAG TPA: adenylate/guanylate cyclase domain-containing protein [Gaiellaceae bacterium]|jgi:YVTN family beta-propeller protein|nr:adenylate/guanylate cyclase domain-containing protein [Gaiellaceae bacterium]
MADLPSGAVTFVFTDIEGSTRLVRQLRGRYADVLAEHQRLLRAAFAKHDGHEIDTQGDAFFYAFGSAHEAVLAAVEAQRALSGYPWPDETEVKVRIGVHTGQAAPVNGRYTGLAVHRAARICAAGHGGQVLVSQSTQSLLEDEEEDLAVRMRDLGDQRLKDIERPVRLYQVTAPGLALEFPPPRGEAPPTDALEATMAAPVWRRTPVLAAAAFVLLALIAAVLVVASRDSAGGLSGVGPNRVGVIDPKTNEIADEIQVGIRPGPVAVGDGAIWVGNLDERTLTKIDAKRRASVGTFPLDNRTPTGIAVGAGSVWVAHGALGKLAAVDPEFGQVTKTIDVAGEALGAANGAVAVGVGAVWAVYGDSTLARIDPTTIRVTGRTFTGSAPAGVVVVNGYVWVVNTHSATVQRFQPATFEEGSLGTPTSVGRRPTAIAGGDGAVWVANTGEDTVTRVELGTAGTAPTAEPIRVGDAPTALAVGAGAVWVANAGDGTVSRIDVAKREVVKTIHVGNAPAGIAVGEGAVWFSVQSP